MIITEEAARAAELYETPAWPIHAILRKELLTRDVLDPCAGRGIMGQIVHEHGYFPESWDLNHWGVKGIDRIGVDFLKQARLLTSTSVIMNPPFSKAVEFVEHAIGLNARKVLCFQRFSWWESEKRRRFWRLHPPSRIYICADRATCWRGDIPEDQRTGGTPTAHAWFIWEQGHPQGTLLGHIRKDEGSWASTPLEKASETQSKPHGSGRKPRNGSTKDPT